MHCPHCGGKIVLECIRRDDDDDDEDDDEEEGFDEMGFTKRQFTGGD